MSALVGAVLHAVLCPVVWATARRRDATWEFRMLDQSVATMRMLGPRCRRCGRPSLYH